MGIESRTLVMHNFNPSTWEAEASRSLFKASLVLSVNSRTVTKRNPVLKNNKQRSKKECVLVVSISLKCASHPAPCILHRLSTLCFLSFCSAV